MNSLPTKSPKGTTFCFYIIPNYVYGTPLYDVNACIVYMVQYLMKNGFYVAYTHPNLLYISWLLVYPSITVILEIPPMLRIQTGKLIFFEFARS